ncbi:MAG: PAS domain S-box protein [Pseudanabaenaceae cyanobacterium bins.68]|nr:PAS domain S-box protein [Pseudanabaenaceae cyanobacterium bins.68]
MPKSHVLLVGDRSNLYTNWLLPSFEVTCCASLGAEINIEHLAAVVVVQAIAQISLADMLNLRQSLAVVIISEHMIDPQPSYVVPGRDLTPSLLRAVIWQQISETKCAQLRHQLSLEQAVNLLLQSIHSSSQLSDIFTAARLGVSRILQLDQVLIRQFWGELGRWTLSNPEPQTQELQIPEQDIQVFQRLRQGEVVAINSGAMIDGLTTRIDFQQFTCSYLIVPLIIDTEIWGSLSLACSAPNRAWQSPELELAIKIGNQIAIAIQRHNFAEDLQAELQERRQIEIQQQQTELALDESQQRYQQMIEMQSDYILHSLQDTTIIFANHALCNLLGLSLGQVIGKKWIDFIEPSEFEKIIGKIRQLCLDAPTFIFENEDQRAHQTKGWTQWLNRGIFNRYGELVEIQSVGRDISALKEAELELKRVNQELEERIQTRTAALWHSRETLRLTLENTPIGILTLSLNGNFLSANQFGCQIFGHDLPELLDMNLLDLIHPNCLNGTQSLLAEIQTGEVNGGTIEQQFIHPSGRLVEAIARIAIVRDHHGQPLHLVAGIEDVTERNRTQQYLQAQLQHQNLINQITQQVRQSLDLDQVLKVAVEQVMNFFQSDRAIIFQLFADGQSQIVKEQVKPEFSTTLHLSWLDENFTETVLRHYLQGQPRIVHNVYQDSWSACLQEFMQTAQIKSKIVAPIIQNVPLSDHPNRWQRGDLQLWGLLVVHACVDFRAWQPQEADLLQQVANQLAIALQQANLYHQVQQQLLSTEKLSLQLGKELHQKEILLKEIHHRVKNNLQVMSSLLRLQFRKSAPEVKLLSEEYQNRIQSMALIHDQLHRSEDLAHIDFYQYVTNLTSNLFQCYGADPKLIKLHLVVKDIFLPLDQSIPLGLIINELVSNCLKYAFPMTYGNLEIRLMLEDQCLELIVADDGVGIPADLDITTTDSLGMQLVHSLTAQLEGTVSCDRDSGTRFVLRFPLSPS